MSASPEAHLANNDPVLARIIGSLPDRWVSEPTEGRIWGLIRIVIAQQISTRAATTLSRRVLEIYPQLSADKFSEIHFDPALLRKCGLSPRKAECCSRIANEASRILVAVAAGESWDSVLGSRPGIGPWTIAIFRILILREPDVLPDGDAGLMRAVREHYGPSVALMSLAEKWQPFKSVACWYLWRSLGNPPLG